MKIITLLSKITFQFSRYFGHYELDIIIDRRLKKVKSSRPFEFPGVDYNLVDDIIQTIEKFKKQFLFYSDIEDKMREPHEKSG
jgi:hypothetical protein